MRFEVPQFIEIEDKIFGPFTWKQFVYLAGGVGLGVVMFFTMPLFVFVLIGVPVGALSALLAFYPVNNRPFSSFLESMVFFYKNNRVYYWRKKATMVYKEKTATPNTTGYDGTQMQPQKNGGINTLSRKLEMHALQNKG
jgi:hypothetical protein